MAGRGNIAGFVWLADLVGAALFAWGIADAVAALAHNVAPSLLAPAIIILGGLIRAATVTAVHCTAIARAQSVIAALRIRLFPHLLGAAPAQPLSAGQAAVFAIDHPVTLENYAARFLPVRLAAAAAPLVIIAIVAWASWVAAAILLVTLLPFGLGMMLAGSMARRASERQLAALGRLSGLFVDRIRTLPMIRHFGAEERIARQVNAGSREVADRTIAVLRVAFLSSAALEFFSALAVALVAVYCGFSLLGLLPFPAPETLTLQTAFFALAMAPEFYLPMRRLAAAYHEKQLGEAARTELADHGISVEEARPPNSPPPAAPAIPAPFAGLEARSLVIMRGSQQIGPVSFRLGLTGLVALIGPTGSGKTSLLTAIAGQLMPSAGSLTAINPAAIGWAAQQPLLLPGSLRDNLALAAPAADDHLLLQVVRMVGLDRLVATRTAGLALPLDHRGSGLSGGERRRVGLARAILSGRPLLLCDEPTADLDDASSAAIIRLLTELAGTHAIIVATHDARLITAADMAVTL